MGYSLDYVEILNFHMKEKRKNSLAVCGAISPVWFFSFCLSDSIFPYLPHVCLFSFIFSEKVNASGSDHGYFPVLFTKSSLYYQFLNTSPSSECIYSLFLNSFILEI